MNQILFLITFSHSIIFTIVKLLPTHTSKQQGTHITRVIQKYIRADFVVDIAVTDMEFEKLIDLVETLNFNISPA